MRFEVWGLQAGVALTDDSLHLGELSSTLFDAHGGLRCIDDSCARG